jgi:hypothetical protein
MVCIYLIVFYNFIQTTGKFSHAALSRSKVSMSDYRLVMHVSVIYRFARPRLRLPDSLSVSCRSVVLCCLATSDSS